MNPTAQKIGIGTGITGGIVALAVALSQPVKPPVPAMDVRQPVVVAAAQDAPTATVQLPPPVNHEGLAAKLAGLQAQHDKLTAAAMGPPAPIVVMAPPGPDLSKQLADGFKSLADGMLAQTKVILDAQPKPMPPGPDLSKQLADGINVIVDRLDRQQAAQVPKAVPQVQELPPTPIIPQVAPMPPPVVKAPDDKTDLQRQIADLQRQIAELSQLRPIPQQPPAKTAVQRYLEVRAEAIATNKLVVVWVAMPPCVDKPPGNTLFHVCEKWGDITGPTALVCRPWVFDNGTQDLGLAVRLDNPQCWQVMDAIKALSKPPATQAPAAPQGGQTPLVPQPQQFTDPNGAGQMPKGGGYLSGKAQRGNQPPLDHTHTCPICKISWDHYTRPDRHDCPNCHREIRLQDPTPRQPQAARPQQPQGYAPKRQQPMGQIAYGPGGCARPGSG